MLPNLLRIHSRKERQARIFPAYSPDGKKVAFLGRPYGLPRDGSQEFKKGDHCACSESIITVMPTVCDTGFEWSLRLRRWLLTNYIGIGEVEQCRRHAFGES